jgi:RHS repeat-associated protein
VAINLYAWTGHGNGSTDSVANGLNQLASIGGVSTTHDTRGNLTLDPTTGNSYAYSSENLLTSATIGGNAVTATYDPLLRLTQVTGAATTRFGYDGLDTTIETDSAGTTILRRYAPGDGVDEPIVWYEGSGTTDRRWLHADERGSIVAVSDATGNMLSINTYDEFGKPGAANQGRFQYTGQKWIAELGLYDYKARMYAPALGRFLQIDPLGYGSGPNVYAYVRGDPLNMSDPLGLRQADTVILPSDPTTDIIVETNRLCQGSCSLPSDVFGTDALFPPDPIELAGAIIVTAPRIPKPKPKPTPPPKPPTVETPSLDPFTYFHHFRNDAGETICLTADQFARVVDLGHQVGQAKPNGANLKSYYGTPLENTFGSATVFYKAGRAVGFFDLYDFNIGGASRSFSGQLKTIGGAVAGAGGRPFATKYPC